MDQCTAPNVVVGELPRPNRSSSRTLRVRDAEARRCRAEQPNVYEDVEGFGRGGEPDNICVRICRYVTLYYSSIYASRPCIP